MSLCSKTTSCGVTVLQLKYWTPGIVDRRASLNLLGSKFKDGMRGLTLDRAWRCSACHRQCPSTALGFYSLAQCPRKVWALLCALKTLKMTWEDFHIFDQAWVMLPFKRLYCKWIILGKVTARKLAVDFYNPSDPSKAESFTVSASKGWAWHRIFRSCPMSVGNSSSNAQHHTISC